MRSGNPVPNMVRGLMNQLANEDTGLACDRKG
jgi:hypothetical protein